MTILVTGAGIIGCHTAKALAARGDRVVLLDAAPQPEPIAGILAGAAAEIVTGDVADSDALLRLIDRHGITRIVHTAAMLSAGIRRDPRRGIEVNIMGSVNVLDAARTRGLARVVLASSSTVDYAAFASFRGAAMPEDLAMKAVSERPVAIYTATKLATEHLALLYRDTLGVDAVALRYAAVLSAWRGPPSSIPARMLDTLLTAGRAGRTAVFDDPVLLWEGIEEFVDARDCAEANIAALDAPPLPKQGVYHVATGESFTMDEFLAEVRKVVPGLAVEFRAQPKGGFAGFPHLRPAAADPAAAAAELGFRTRRSLADTIAYCAANLG